MASRLSRITSGGNFIPEIDGLRFLAIGSVLLFHASYALSMAFGWTDHTVGMARTNLFGHGALGVELFFVISGFILALPFARHFLYDEKPVKLDRYYLRRLTRLEPPYIAVLVLFYAAAWFAHEPTLQNRFLPTFLARLFYLYGEIYQEAPTVNGVTWSLEIEVQFYLLMPLLALIFLLPAIPRRVGLLLVILLLPFVRWQGDLLFSVLSQLDLFLAGFLFAELFLSLQKRGLGAKIWADAAAVLIFALILALPVATGGFEVRRVLPGLIVLFLLFMFNGVWLRRFFSWKPVYLIGGMCYSIYLLHYPLISTASRWLAHHQPGLGYWPALAVMILLWLPVVVAMATIFFMLIEHPCMDPAWPRKLWSRLKDVSSSQQR